jgi:hypothetical protein
MSRNDALLCGTFSSSFAMHIAWTKICRGFSDIPATCVHSLRLAHTLGIEARNGIQYHSFWCALRYIYAVRISRIEFHILYFSSEQWITTAVGPLSIHVREYWIQNGRSESVCEILFYSFSCQCEPDSSVSIVFGYGLGDRAIKVRSPTEAKGFFL